MKILFLTRSLGVGGAQRQLCALAKQLKSRGFDVSVLVFYDGGVLQDELRDFGVPVTDLGKKGRWDIAAFALRLVTTLRQRRPNIIYAYLSVPNVLAVLSKPFVPGMRVVWGIRASGIESAHYHWTVALLWRMECALSRFADLVICNSHAGLEHAARHGVPRGKMVVIDNGIDTTRFRPCATERSAVRSQWGVAEHEILIGLVARLDPMKDHLTFLKAAALIADERQDTRFVCVGDGPPAYRSKLMDHAQRLGLDGRLAWAGARSDTAAIYCALDVACSSSAFGEGFSNAVAEAMASGVPCVVTDVGDSARVVGDIGRVVPPGDAAALKAATLELVLESRADATLKERSRLRIVTHFGLDTLADATLRDLQRLCCPLPTRHRTSMGRNTAIARRNGDGRAAGSVALSGLEIMEPLRIVFVITGLETGGAEMMLLKVLSRLRRDRYQPFVVSLRAAGDMAERFRSLPVVLHSINMPAGAFLPVGGLVRLVALMRRLRPDLIQGWMYHGNIAAQCVSPFLRRRVPVLWNVRAGGSIPQEKWQTRRLVWLGGRLSHLPERIINNSVASAAAHEQRFGYRVNKRFIIPNGFDTDVFKPSEEARVLVRRELGLQESTLLIGLIGRYHPEKNHHGFLQAAAEIHAVHPDVVFIAAGAGVDRDNAQLVRWIDELKLSDAVRLLGKRSDMPRVTAALDLSVCCSLSEGFPNVVGEAMSCGVPCAVTDVGDCAAVVGDTGKVIPPNNGAALVRVMLELIECGAEARLQLGERARQRVVENFSLDAVVAMYERLYESVATQQEQKCVA